MVEGGVGEALEEAKGRLARARGNREQLRLHYSRKEEEAAREGATLEVYQQMKDSYFGLVRQAGELDMEVRELEQDLVTANNGLQRLQREVWAIQGPSLPPAASPWGVGVPYGSGRSGK